MSLYIPIDENGPVAQMRRRTSRFVGVIEVWHGEYEKWEIPGSANEIPTRGDVDAAIASGWRPDKA